MPAVSCGPGRRRHVLRELYWSQLFSQCGQPDMRRVRPLQRVLASLDYVLSGANLASGSVRIDAARLVRLAQLVRELLRLPCRMTDAVVLSMEAME
jgi:hypothetical protein